MKKYKGIVLVTGSSSGIGAAICRLLCDCGAIVYGVSRSGRMPEGMEDCPLMHSCVADVNSDKDMKDLVERIVAREGWLDAVVCNAGNGIAGAVEEATQREIDYQMSTTFMGMVNTIRACMPVFRAQEYGRVITISSVAAVAPLPFQGFYSCAKAAILQLTGVLGIEAGRFGVQTCCILPGDVKTGFTRARVVCEQTARPESPYYDACRRSLLSMEKDEQVEGLEPSVIAEAVLCQLKARRMRPQCVPSLKYKFLTLLIRILPQRLVLRVIGMMY